MASTPFGLGGKPDYSWTPVNQLQDVSRESKAQAMLNGGKPTVGFGFGSNAAGTRGGGYLPDSNLELGYAGGGYGNMAYEALRDPQGNQVGTPMEYVDTYEKGLMPSLIEGMVIGGLGAAGAGIYGAAAGGSLGGSTAAASSTGANMAATNPALIDSALSTGGYGASSAGAGGGATAAWGAGAGYAADAPAMIEGADATGIVNEAGQAGSDFGVMNTGAPETTTQFPASSDFQGVQSTIGNTGTNSTLSNLGTKVGDGLANFGGKFGDALVNVGAAGLAGALVNKLGPDAPATPDLVGAAQAQGKANQEAAAIQTQMGRVDTTTPFGFQKFGTVDDPSVPGGKRYTQEIGLSPEQQKLYEAETRNQQGMQDLAGSLQGRVGESLANPFSLSSAGDAQKLTSDPGAYTAERDQVQQALYDRLTRTRQPQMERDRAAADNTLRNQGLMPGTEAYDNSMRTLMEAQSGEMQDYVSRSVEAGGLEQSRLQNDVRQNAGFNNQTRGQSIQELLMQRQQPL